MAFQVVVNPSDLTPPPGAFQHLVDKVLAASGAGWIDTAEDADLTLADGSEISLFLDDEENVAAFVLESPNEAAFDLIHGLADRAGSFVCLGERACALLTTGAILPAFAEDLVSPEAVPDRRVFGDWMRVAMHAAQAAPASQTSHPPRRSLFQRLSDSLFGKEI